MKRLTFGLFALLMGLVGAFGAETALLATKDAPSVVRGGDALAGLDAMGVSTRLALSIVGYPSRIPLAAIASSHSGYTVYGNGTNLVEASISGDLSGSMPSPTVSQINGAALGSTTPTSGNVMIGSGTQWVTKPFSGDGTLASTGALTLATVNSNTGTFADASHVAQITLNGKGLTTAASSVSIAIAASQVTSGQLTVARGGTGLDGSVTGGTGQFVKQTTLGGAFSVSTIATGDLPSLGSQAGSQSANAFFAAPDNSSGTPSFRALVPRDIAASPLQGTIPYATSATGLAWLGTGTANQLLTTGGASANPSYQSIASLVTAGTNITKSGTTNVTINAPTMTSTVGGAVPTPPNDATKYLDGTGAFSTPAGGGGSPGGGSGSVQYNSSGSFGGSSNFTWDNTNQNIATGGLTPLANGSLTVSGLGEFRRASGNGYVGVSTAAFPTSGGILGILEFFNVTSGTQYKGANISAQASENQSSTHMGTQLQFKTTANGSTTPTERLKIGNSGLTTFDCGLNLPVSVQSAEATVSVSDSDFAFYMANDSTANSSVTLPAANAASGRLVMVMNTSAGATKHTNVLRAGSDSINFVAGTYSLSTTQGSMVLLQSDGVSNWYVLASK